MKSKYPLPLTGAYGLSITYQDRIVINSKTYNGAIASPEGAVLFAHEITHQSQGIHEFTVQGELLAEYFQYQLESEFGNSIFPIAQWGVDNELNPWDETDLKKFQDYLKGVYNYMSLMIGNGLPKEWILQWGTDYPKKISGKVWGSP